jgi:molecular chaperone HtpG
MAFPTAAETAASKAVNSEAFGKLNLAHIRTGVESILKLIGRDSIFDTYTLHDMSHIDELLRLLDIIIPRDTAALMTPADWLLVVLACYFHDLGLLVTKHEYASRQESGFPAFKTALLSGDAGKDYGSKLERYTPDERERFLYEEYVRFHHPDRIYYWVRGQAPREFGASGRAVEVLNDLLDGIQMKFREDLALVCRSHHREDLDKFDIYVTRRAYGQNADTYANVHYAALLLRTADLLHIRKNRVPSQMFKLIDPSNPKSQEEWAKQMGVRAVLTSRSSPSAPHDDIFEVQADFNHESGFFGLTAYLQYVRSQLTQTSRWAEAAAARGAEHRFPWRGVDDSQVEARGFLPQRFEFTLDRERILQLLTGHTLYNDAGVAVRELLQNAIDAVRFRHHLHPTEPMGEIMVDFNSNTRRLALRDNGVGMTQRTIEDHLLKVGASYYQDPQFRQRHPGFSPISRFGIGVLSTFMVSDDVEITTIHPDEDLARRLSLPSALQRYLVKTLPKDDPSVASMGGHGTEVALTVRASVRLPDLKALVKYWVVMPGCRVTVSVDGSPPESVGYDDARAALDDYYERFEPKRNKVRTRTKTGSRGGVSVAFAVRHDPFFDVWEFVSRGDKDKEMAEWSRPPGLCLEGIRVQSAPAGYSTEGPWVLANLTGPGVPRTNVARSGLEHTPELNRALEDIYGILTEHVQEEFLRLREGGVGLAKAAAEADYLWSGGLDRYKLTSQQAFDRRIDDLSIVAVEDKGETTAMPRGKLRGRNNVWTVDGPLVEYIDGLTGKLNVQISASDVIRRLTGSEPVTLPMPRVLGRSIKPLIGLEVAGIRIDAAEPLIELRWAKAIPRWRTIDTSRARRLIADFAMEVVGDRAVHFPISNDIEFDCGDVDTVEWRGRVFVLPSSPLMILFKAMGPGDQLARWVKVYLESRRISPDERPILREQLRERDIDADAVIRSMADRADKSFALGRLQRGAIQW